MSSALEVACFISAFYFCLHAWIEKAHELEIKKREEANKRYSDAVKEIEKKHEEDKMNITKSKKEAVKRMVNKAKHSPEEIDRILEQELGIQKG